jgi:signal transduction histidine kinase/ligand-binding sensor domain-containing protein
LHVRPIEEDSVASGRYIVRMSSRSLQCPSLAGALLIAVIWSIATPAAGGESQNLSITQFNHTAWKAADGAPSDAWALAQTVDGWLWLGTSMGLYRFDGIHFEHVEIDGLDPRRSRAISMLLALDSGELWIGYVYGGASRLKDGHFTHFGESDGMGHGSVIDLEQDAKGELLAASTDALVRFDGNRWHRIGVESGYPDRYAQAVFRDQRDRLWVAGAQEIFVVDSGGSLFHRTGMHFTAAVGFIQSPDGRTWYADGAGVHALPDQMSTSPRQSSINARRSYITLFDDTGDIWSATRGVAHWPSTAMRSAEKLLLQADQAVDTFTPKDGLTNGIVKTMMQDREGNIWVSTMGGIDRFRRPNVIRLLPVLDSAVALAAGEEGSVWIGTTWGNDPQPTDGLWKYDGSLRRIPQYTAGAVTAIDRDRHGVLWVGGDRGIWRNDDGEHFHKLPDLPEGALGQEVHALTIDAAGAPWASILRSSLFRFRDGVWERNGGIPELPDQRPQIHALDQKGRLWIGYRDGSLSVVEGDHARTFGPKDGLDIGTIFAISVGRHTIVAGEETLAILDGGRFHPLAAVDPTVLQGVTGIAQVGNGDLWLNGFRGAVRIPASDLESALRQRDYRVSYELFDAGDGFPGFAQRRRPVPTLIQGTDGRLWFAGTLGLAWIDPAHLNRNETPPPLIIRSLAAGDRTYEASGRLQLPKATKSLQVDYTALSLSRPERTRFRYQLEGSDPSWVEAGTRRQAFYTNLGPGQYRFHVIAENENGIWNLSGASLDITIPPMFVQTKVFIALCGAAGLGLLWCLYHLRARQLTARERGRLEARLSERERIARELHDTLLQSVQGLTLRFHTVAKQVPPGSPVRESIDKALETADRVFAEGRDRVQALRTGEDPTDDLQKSISELGADLAQVEAASFRFIVTGTPRPLRPVARSEILLIAREALTNAFRHAAATSIQAEVAFGQDELCFRVRDDGHGIEVEVLRAGGRPGHWGLAGMRERAKGIRATFNIQSHSMEGTEVELIVPGEVAYADERNIPHWLQFRRGFD